MLLKEIKEIKSTNKDLRSFGLVVGGFLLILAFAFYLYAKSFYLYFAVAGGLLILLGFVLPKVLLPFQKLWMAIAVVLGFIMTKIILITLFYFILTPISLIARLFRKQFLDLSFKSGDSTFWKERQIDQFSKEIHEQQF